MRGTLKPLPGVGPVAKRPVLGVAASAQGKDGPAREAVSIPGGITDGDLAFDAEGSVVEDSDFGWHPFDPSKMSPLADSPEAVVN